MAKSSSRQRRAAPAATTAVRETRMRYEGAPLTVTATEAKNRFGPLLEKAIQGRSIVITKHDTPKAVLLSVAEFESLVRSSGSSLDSLTDEFDGLLARLQSASSRKALQSAFGAGPAELGRLAVVNAKRRG